MSESGDLPPGMPLGLAALLAGVQQNEDRAHMHSDLKLRQVDGLLSCLDVEQLLTLRWMFNRDSDSRTNNYFEGVISGILRHIHKVDDYTGKPLDPDVLLRESGDA